MAGKPRAELEGTAMEVSWPFGYRTKIFMKAVDGRPGLRAGDGSGDDIKNRSLQSP